MHHFEIDGVMQDCYTRLGWKTERIVTENHVLCTVYVETFKGPIFCGLPLGKDYCSPILKVHSMECILINENFKDEINFTASVKPLRNS